MCDTTIIAAAWQNFKPQLEQRLTDEVAKQPQLNNILHRQELNICYLLGGAVSSIVPNQATWRPSGSGTLSLDSLKLAELTGLSLEPAQFSGHAATLPLGFSTLSVAGHYGLVQPCTEYSVFATELGRENYVSQGRIKQTVHDGRIVYHATFADDCKLAFLSAEVHGPPRVEVTRDGGPDDILNVLEQLLTGDPLAGLIRSAAGNVFEAKGFSSEMIALLNQEISKLAQPS